MSKITGTIQYQTFAAGTKSESQRPYICCENGTKILLYKKNDNPFENKGFTEFNGKKVHVEGELENGTFVVVQIEEAAVSKGSGIINRINALKEAEKTENKEKSEKSEASESPAPAEQKTSAGEKCMKAFPGTKAVSENSDAENTGAENDNKLPEEK